MFLIYYPFLFFLIYSQLSFFDLILFNRQMLRIVENILSYIGLMLKLTFSETGKKKEYFEVWPHPFWDESGITFSTVQFIQF